MHHKQRYREAIWRHRNRTWWIIGADDNGAPIAIATSADRTILRLLYREHMRRR